MVQSADGRVRRSNPLNFSMNSFTLTATGKWMLEESAKYRGKLNRYRNIWKTDIKYRTDVDLCKEVV